MKDKTILTDARKQFEDKIEDIVLNTIELDGKPVYKGFKYVTMANLLKRELGDEFESLLSKKMAEVQNNYNFQLNELELKISDLILSYQKDFKN